MHTDTQRKPCEELCVPFLMLHCHLPAILFTKFLKHIKLCHIFWSLKKWTCSHTFSSAVRLYGAPRWEGEVERGGVSTGEEEYPNRGPQWGGVCPVPGRRCLAPGLLQRRSGARDGFLQHECHGWDRVGICRCGRRGGSTAGKSRTAVKMRLGTRF